MIADKEKAQRSIEWLTFSGDALDSLRQDERDNLLLMLIEAVERE